MAVERYAVTDTSSTRPYLIRAIHEWCADNGLTPYVAVQVDDVVQVPREYVKNGEIVLNISYDATNGLALGNEFIEFKARFGGVPRDILIPVGRVIAIYARENGQGMAFPAPVSPSDAPVRAGPTLMRLATTPKVEDLLPAVEPDAAAPVSVFGGGQRHADGPDKSAGNVPVVAESVAQASAGVDVEAQPNSPGRPSVAPSAKSELRPPNRQSGAGGGVALAAVGTGRAAPGHSGDLGDSSGTASRMGADSVKSDTSGESGSPEGQPPRPRGGGKPPLKRIK